MIYISLYLFYSYLLKFDYGRDQIDYGNRSGFSENNDTYFMMLCLVPTLRNLILDFNKSIQKVKYENFESNNDLITMMQVIENSYLHTEDRVIKGKQLRELYNKVFKKK